MTTMMRALCNCYLRNGRVDIRLRTGCAIQLYKSKGARTDANNYRGITLIDIICKIYCELINRRIVRHCEEHGFLTEHQNGFRKHRCGAHHLFCMMKSLKILRSMGKQARIFFLDYRKAFDTVPHDILWNRLRTIGIPPRTTQLYPGFVCKSKHQS